MSSIRLLWLFIMDSLRGIICIDSLPFERDSISGNSQPTFLLGSINVLTSLLAFALFFFSLLVSSFTRKLFLLLFLLAYEFGMKSHPSRRRNERNFLFLLSRLWENYGPSRLPVARVKIARRRSRDSFPFRSIQLADKRREEFLSKCMRWEWI